MIEAHGLVKRYGAARAHLVGVIRSRRYYGSADHDAIKDSAAVRRAAS